MKFTHYSKGLLRGQRQYIGVFLRLLRSLSTSETYLPRELAILLRKENLKAAGHD